MSEELIKAAQMALEALILASGQVHNHVFVKVMMAHDALGTALTQASKPTYAGNDTLPPKGDSVTVVTPQ
jgi:hypothetical protein